MWHIHVGVYKLYINTCRKHYNNVSIMQLINVQWIKMWYRGVYTFIFSYPMTTVFTRGRMDLELIPLRIELRALLIIELIFVRKVLINVLLWNYQSKSIKKNIFNYNDAEPDNTPPDFTQFSRAVGHYSIQTSVHNHMDCFCYRSDQANATRIVWQVRVIVFEIRFLFFLPNTIYRMSAKEYHIENHKPYT